MFRPINLLSSVSKILEKVIKNKIINEIDEKEIIPPQQFGFQPLYRIKKIINQNFQQTLSTSMVLLDIQAAFDCVWHDALIFKMIQKNFTC